MPYMVAANGLTDSHRWWNRSARSRAAVMRTAFHGRGRGTCPPTVAGHRGTSGLSARPPGRGGYRAHTRESGASGMFAADEEVGRDLAAVDWAATPLGPSAAWPQSLQTAVDILLSSRFPMWLAWGP